MSIQYDPKDHIQHLAIAPRAEGILDQREITIQSYQTTVPFDFKEINAGLERAWLTPAIRFGVFSRAEVATKDCCAVVLGLQDELSIRAYDYDTRRPLWFSWQDIIVDTVSIRYSKDDAGMLRFTTTGGGRRITDDRLQEFNNTFLGIPKEAVSKLHFDLAKLRDLCFGRFIDHLYMVKFSDPSGEEYRSIDHALFQSREYIDPVAERLQEVRADSQVKIESFDSDIGVRSEALAEPVQVRFFIRGLSGSLRLRFPKLLYKSQLATPEEQAKVFYDIVDVTVDSILDADYYAEHLHSLDDLNADLDVFPDMVDLSPLRGVLLNTKAMQKFFSGLDLDMRSNKWQPHLRAIDELLPSVNVAENVKILITDLVVRDSLLAARLLVKCQEDAKMHRVGYIVADAISVKLQSLRTEIRSHVEEALLSWAVDRELDTWEIDPDTGEISMLNLRRQMSDLSVDVLPPVLWKLVGVLHSRLVVANDDTGSLLRRFNWCMTAAKSLPSNHSKLRPAFRLVVDQKVPISIAGGARVLKEPVADLPSLDDAVMNQFGLPLWPFLVASRENGQVRLRNTGIGVAIAVRATSIGTLFSDKETPVASDISPDESIVLPISGIPTALDVRFSKFGKEHRIKLQLEEHQNPDDTKKAKNRREQKELAVNTDDKANTIVIDLASFSNRLSKNLLEDLIARPGGVTYNEEHHGKRQPAPLKEALKRGEYEHVAGHIHKQKNKIFVKGIYLVKNNT